MKELLSVFGERVLDLVYPSNIYCICCGNLIDNSRPYSLCDTCVRTLKWANGRTCSWCGKILQEGYGPELCTDCMELDHVFEKGYTCVEYGAAEREILHQFKYKDKAYLGRKLSELMYDRIQSEELHPDLLLPVPMFLAKERKRGYNQAAVLAMLLAKAMKKPYNGTVLVRNTETEAMSSLSAAERRRNIQEAFTIPANKREIITDKRILLIDDIFTTGSTADACASTLLEAGASKVWVFTFAAGANLIKGEADLF